MPNPPSKTTHQEEVSVLSSAKHGLTYLTANDWTLIADKALKKEFAAGESLVKQGKRTNGIYLLLKGTASVQIPGPAVLPSIGPGEICGEISFLDDEPATVDVIAKAAVEAYYLDRATLQTLFELFPHLGSRFYRSVAGGLARRIRSMLAQTAKS
ncbi:MAG TPA: cyclic nucleotide-binding domain-containing protein [Verrucomicrobiae bacterium]|nr:cyclic nucleotide-binding domain-containing protein [Verrucomicrobiae bacterium]